MATVTMKLFGQLARSLAEKRINLTGDDIYAMLTNDAPNQDTWQFKSQVTGETSGTGYTAGGQKLTKTGDRLSYDAASNGLTFDMDDVSWSGSTVSAKYIVLYDNSSGGSDSLRPLIAYGDFGGVSSSTSAAFTVTWATDGIFTLTAA